ncbi:MAG: cyclic nucleotide-binding domain-containing protein [Bacteriovoracaceae bacterium]|nr:cyclic nucleotide-binding domain-containing protein [Bacteriovoracaceae bacterium]HNU75135.1 cyclic nucleotide-binding domain-containing protein [Deltaproteobacteria bacterium]HRR19988.1 cyclic nucleotide-binding domain-containing protein [Desulfomonilia bacterium]HOD71988.1 cyclic nucleotide-binding domain-containing protein [Deltaproteobacteria bacterium]HOE72938.1 cyclic nucleotide-binding domain-containing protein [Deltaproteobacteria bacterium]
MLESQYLAGRDDLLESMKKVPFLRSYSDKFLRKILELSKIRRYQAGEVITREGEYDCWLYVILAGEVKVVKNEEEIARLDAAGGTFGELAVIDGEPRSAATFAASETTCLAIDSSFIDRLDPRERREFEAVYFRLLSEILAHRLRQTSEELSLLKQELELVRRI